MPTSNFPKRRIKSTSLWDTANFTFSNLEKLHLLQKRQVRIPVAVAARRVKRNIRAAHGFYLAVYVGGIKIPGVNHGIASRNHLDALCRQKSRVYPTKQQSSFNAPTLKCDEPPSSIHPEYFRLSNSVCKAIFVKKHLCLFPIYRPWPSTRR